MLLARSAAAGMVVAAAVGLPGTGQPTPVESLEARRAQLARTPVARIEQPERRPVAAIPSQAALRRARVYSRRAGGSVSFAVIDSEGRLRGRALDRRFVSASVVKAMLLAAELRRLERTGTPLDAATRVTLTR